MNWIQLGTLGIGILCLVLTLVVFLRVPKNISSRFDALDAKWQAIDRLERATNETSMYARDAKLASVQLTASFNQFDGRFIGLNTHVSQLAEGLAGLQPSIASVIAHGMVQLKDVINSEHGSLRSELSDRDTRNSRDVAEKIATGFQTIANSVAQIRTETNAMLKSNGDSLANNMTELRASNDAKLAEIVTRTTESASTLNQTAQQTIATVADRLTELKSTVDSALKAELGTLRSENTVALDAMRATVDEKLHATLEKRLGESFFMVSEKLEQVHRGLGEMQSLAVGVGDLRKVLTNVKTRGTWGEVQLETLLDQMLTVDQYSKNVATKPGSNARVEFAIRFPGRTETGSIWLPIDAKFPLEDYQRLIEAQELADVPAIEAAGKSLEARIKSEARNIREKYIEPPATTDFAILYLPTEGLYAEVLRRPGLSDAVQRECKILLCGPTTLAALLNSLQMGFRTLAIEKRSSEVWTVLGHVKAEFKKFGEALAHTKKKLDEASSSIESAEQRNRVLTRKLNNVEELPTPEAASLLSAAVGTAVGLELGESGS